MSTWHQDQAMRRNAQSKNPVMEGDPVKWSVIINPPHSMLNTSVFDTHELAKVYMRNLKANNAGAYQYARIVPPNKK